MKARLWCKVEVKPRNVDIAPSNDEDDDDLYLIEPDIRCHAIDYLEEGGRNFTTNLPVHTSLQLRCQYLVQILEPKEGEPKEIVFTRVQDTGNGLRVHFRFQAQQDSKQ